LSTQRKHAQNIHCTLYTQNCIDSFTSLSFPEIVLGKVHRKPCIVPTQQALHARLGSQDWMAVCTAKTRTKYEDFSLFPETISRKIPKSCFKCNHLYNIYTHSQSRIFGTAQYRLCLYCTANTSK
jgi:hypothetical protein